jgi:hypothetical protein
LGDPILADCRVHYNKALRFFHTFPTPESANTIKEAVCALEAAASSLTGRSSKEDLSKAITRLQGNAPGQIPAPIAQGMIKLYGYRGGAKGVAHAARDGNRASELEAELVLSLAASYITYLYDLLKESNDIPF